MLTSLLSSNTLQENSNSMENLSKIQNFSQKLGTDINIPQFVLIGTQSAGKTTLINRLSGFTHDLFKSDVNMTTRIAMRITLTKCNKTSFLVDSESATDQTMFYSLLQRKTDFILKGKKVADPLSEVLDIQIMSPKIHTSLTFLDLPGIIQVHEKYPDVPKKIESLLTRHCKPLGNIILAVIPARVDIETDPVLRFVQENSLEKRTIGVLTKVDLMTEKECKMLQERIRNSDIFSMSEYIINYKIENLSKMLSHRLMNAVKNPIRSLLDEIDNLSSIENETMYEYVQKQLREELTSLKASLESGDVGSKVKQEFDQLRSHIKEYEKEDIEIDGPSEGYHLCATKTYTYLHIVELVIKRNLHDILPKMKTSLECTKNLITRQFPVDIRIHLNKYFEPRVEKTLISCKQIINAERSTIWTDDKDMLSDFQLKQQMHTDVVERYIDDVRKRLANVFAKLCFFTIVDPFVENNENVLQFLCKHATNSERFKKMWDSNNNEIQLKNLLHEEIKTFYANLNN